MKTKLVSDFDHFDFDNLKRRLSALVARELDTDKYSFKDLDLNVLLTLADFLVDEWKWSYSPINYSKNAIISLENNGVDKNGLMNKLAHVLAWSGLYLAPVDVNAYEWGVIIQRHKQNYNRALTTLTEAFSAIMLSEIQTEFKIVPWLMEHEIKVILFDADGTLSPMRVGSVGAFGFELMPNVEDTIKEIQKKLPNIQIGIISNQSGRRDLVHIVTQLAWTAGKLNLHWDKVRFSNAKSMKKPNTYMADQLLEEFNIQFQGDSILVVGDRETDDGGLAANLGAHYIHPETFFNW